jgi:TolA-binding protein
MQRTIYLSLFLATILAAPALAQQESLDDISQKATQLEAELGKLRDTSPEAAEVMVKLVDVYYDQGRVFGLIRVGQTFITQHPSHPKHKDVMIKLVDGLQVTSRNKELTALCRQFLARYPDDKACTRMEVLLAGALDQLEDRPKAAEAHEAIWKRQKDTPQGRQSGIRAMNLYVGLNNKDGWTRAAQIGESMVDTLPASGFVADVGMQSVLNWQRISDWVKSNAAANKLLKKNAVTNKDSLAYLHTLMASNYANQNQRANAVESYRKSRALVDTRDALVRLISEQHNAQAKPAEMEPLVNEFYQKYPDRPERFLMKSYLAHAYLRANEKAKTLEILAQLMPDDAASNGNASVYVQQNGNEPEKVAQSEKLLVDALAKNKAHAAYLRYTLALEVYRDRVKDLAKARQTIRDLIAQSPSNDGYTTGAIKWLLHNPEDEAAFKRDVAKVLEVRTANIQMTALRGILAEWSREAKGQKEKEIKDRANWVKDQVEAADKSPFIVDWIAGETNNRPGLEARTRLIEPANYAKLNDGQAMALLRTQGESLRYTGPVEQRARAIEPYAMLAKRFPKDYPIAQAYLEVASDNGTPEQGKEAAQHFMTFDPPVNNSDAWRRLVWVADKAKDAALVKTAHAWIEKSQKKHGLDVGNASYIGDILEKYELKNEALAYWRRTLTINPDNYETMISIGRISQRLQGAERIAFLREQLKQAHDYHGAYAMLLADELLKVPDMAGFEKTLRDTRTAQNDRPLRPWGLDESLPLRWIDQFRNDKNATEGARKQVYTAIRDLNYMRPSALASMALLEMTPPETFKPMERLLAYQAPTTLVDNGGYDWDLLMVYAQAAMARKDYSAAATLVTGMLSNIPNVDPGRKQTGRDIVGQSYARMGAAGLSIDESSPIAPLLQAALYLRLGDERLAFESYTANKKLFDEHRNELPTDLILFVCESHIAAGGDENHDRAEDILRTWLVKNSEAKEVEEPVKASMQLLLAKNFFKSQRYDVARSEYTTVINRYPKSPQAIEAEFGIGESFMAQKVYDQAEAVFERLVNSQDRDTVVRAEFLRGVLASRRGDRDEAREIFRGVLDRVPNVELANQALFNLAEVYGAEQRYMDQLELLRTVGRLGRSSQRLHAPGVPLSIVVQDSDLGISRGHAKIPVKVTTEPGGDEETIYLYSGGAGKGLFRADLETRLGQVTKHNKVLELTGKDTIKCDYPAEFKAEFKNVPLSDAEIKIASDAKLKVASTKIIDEAQESFSEKLEREAREQAEAAGPIAERRPTNQIKPGNQVYLQVEDPDRDMSDEVDEITVKLVASSGDQVHVAVKETGSHTGIFEAIAKTGELPAGALASDSSINHSPLMSIDKDQASYWLSEPDGAAPKWLSVDMKDLRVIDHVTFTSPKADQQVPLRAELEGSNDGRYWFVLGANPALPTADPVAGEYGKMTRRIYQGNYTGYTEWTQIINLSKNEKPIEQSVADQLTWTAPDDAESTRPNVQKPHGVIWHGKLVQPRAGAARFLITGVRTAMAIDGKLYLPPGVNNRTVDVWLEPGTHDVAIFAATLSGQPTVTASWAREDYSADRVVLSPIGGGDFDLGRPEAKPATLRKPGVVTTKDGVWDFQFEPIPLRHVRLVVREYSGEAVAVSQVAIRSEAENKQHIPTDADLLSLATNDTLELAAGDKVTATYADETTQTAAGRSSLLAAELTATYNNARVTPINYEFVRFPNGQVFNQRKEVIRVDPGERFVVEIVDYDMDQSVGMDKVTFQVSVNDGTPVEFTAQENEQQFQGTFTKEIDTAAEPTPGKLHVKPGDRIFCMYKDGQNTFPGHAVNRETTVYVNEPSEGQIRVVETRVIRPKAGSTAPPRTVYLPPTPDKDINNVAFEAPLTIEVIDRDAAKDSRSVAKVTLSTTDGAQIDVDCVVARDLTLSGTRVIDRKTLEEGRFVGQVILQLGGKDSPDLVPIVAGMPRNLIGGSKVSEEQAGGADETLVTRVLNLSGKDIIKAVYRDGQRPGGSPQDLTAQGRLIANGTLACTDREYTDPITSLHVGEKMFLVVTDADLDISDERDHAKVEVSTERGEKETIELEETLAHSGIFTGSVLLKPAEKPTAGNLSPESPQIETYFGDTVRLSYVDKAASTETGELKIDLELPVVIGTDGLVAAFSKTFEDESLAVETQFHIAESYFELFKSHQKLARGAEEKNDLEAGRRVLREVMEDYPNPKYVPRIAYLLGQFAQELKQYDEAISSYQMIIRQYPDSPLAPDAQYKLAQCHEDAGDFDDALEAYVTLAATYPKNPLIANVMIRISEYFYKHERFDVAGQVGEKFLERFEGHEWGPRMAFRVGQCYYKGKEYSKAGQAFDRFAKIFPDDQLAADAWFWSGESYRMGNNVRDAFRRYNNCRWNFPSSEAAKYARGRLALPEMLQQFEAEANNVEE